MIIKKFFDGKFTEYYDNGQVKEKGVFKDNKKRVKVLKVLSVRIVSRRV